MLDETLDMDTKSRKVIGEEIIETEEPALLKIKQDSAKFVASGLGKAKYSSRANTPERMANLYLTMTPKTKAKSN